MAAFFHHRKLMPSSNLTQSCSSVCLNNTTAAAVCTIKACSAVCPLICPPQTYPALIPFTPLESPPSPPSSYLPNTHSKLSPTLKISIAFLVATFSVFVLYTLYKFYTVWSRSRGNHSGHDDSDVQTRNDEFFDEGHGPVVDHPIWYIRTIGLEQSVINAITIVKYKRGEGLVEGTDCSVCLSEFEEDETLRLLPKCSHAFHIRCIDTWLQSHTNCPLCRAGIVRNVSVPELVVDDYSGSVEETQLGISVNIEESEMSEREDNNGGSELRDEDEMSKLEMGNGEVVMRRSVSLDCISAARLSAEITKAYRFQSDRNLGSIVEESNLTSVVHGRVESGCSIARSLQRGPDFIKRSFSCSEKVFFSRQSR